MKHFLLITLIISGFASATTSTLDRALSVHKVFAEGNYNGGFYPTEPLPECKWNLMYVDLSTEGGRGMFSLLISAKAADQKLSRIDYEVRDSGTCLIKGLHIL